MHWPESMESASDARQLREPFTMANSPGFQASLCARAGTQTLLKKYNENPTVVTSTAAALAVAGVSVFLLTELETVLQLVGVAFALQFLARKLVFAEEREKTFKEVKYLIQDKIAAGVCFHC
jgi:hypothetical protein